MKNKFKIYIFLLQIIFLSNFVYGEELNFESEKIKIEDKGNIIIAEGKVKAKTKDNLEINSEESEYNKKDLILKLRKKVKINDKNKGIIILAKEVIYDQNKNIIISIGETEINYKNNYKIIGSDFTYDRNQEKISTPNKNQTNDKLGVVLNSSELNFLIEKNEIRAKEIVLFDEDNNQYKLDYGIVDLDTNEIIAQNAEINLENSIFGNINNDPRIKGKSLITEKEKTILYKGVFTSCKKIKNKCPDWSLYADKVTHDKIKKKIEYKNAWIKLFDKPVVYFPYFFHPDPTVERQSGFLMPTFLNSTFSGQSVQLPYFKVISDSKDMTISPRIFFDDNIIFQTEYRQANKNSLALFDFSFNKNQNNSNIHFFSNIIGKHGDKDVSLNIQKVNNDDYLNLYSLTSPIINVANYDVLNSNFTISNNFEDSSYQVSFEIYEDLNKLKSDRYEYIYPNYKYSKNYENFDFFDGSVVFDTYGFQKQFNTNVSEKSIINDLVFNSNTSIKSGFQTKYSFLLKNLNTDATNSTSYPNTVKNKLLSTLLYEVKYPLFKSDNNSTSLLTPIFSARTSPTETKNKKNLDRIIKYNNIYSLNRIGENDLVEGGESITMGIEYQNSNLENNNSFSLGMASVFRNEKNYDLPSKTTIGEKNSDIIGSANFEANEMFKFHYDFIVDSSLKETNYNLISTSFSINNFVTEFSYLEEDNLIGENSFISNQTKYQIDEKNSLSLNMNKNLNLGMTEYYDIIYEYESDCLKAGIQFNNKFYKDSSIGSQKEIFLFIKISPIGDILDKTPIYAN